MRLFKDLDNELMSDEYGVFYGGMRYWGDTFYYVDKINGFILMIRLDNDARYYHL